MAKNVFGWRVGFGSLDSAVSSGGGGGATFLGFGGAAVAVEGAGVEGDAAPGAGAAED